MSQGCRLDGREMKSEATLTDKMKEVREVAYPQVTREEVQLPSPQELSNSTFYVHLTSDLTDRIKST